MTPKPSGRKAKRSFRKVLFGIFPVAAIMSTMINDGDDREKFDKMAAMTVAAARGVVPVGQVALPLAQITSSSLAPPEGRHLAGVLLRILKGERDRPALAAGLPPRLVPLLHDVLDQIETPDTDASGGERSGLTFEELLEKVAEACTGEVLLWQQLWTLTEELATGEDLPPDIRALGAVLRKILAGERQKHVLADLALGHRPAVEQLLDWLLARSAQPDGPAEP